MKHIWFKKFGWVYLPVNVPGVLVSAIILAFCLQVFMVIDRHSHSVSDTLYGIFPYIVPAFLLYLWVGSETSEKETS